MRRWLITSIVGVALVSLVLLISALVVFDKKHFGWMVGSGFLLTTTAAMIIGALLVLVAAWNLRHEGTWRWIALLIWSLLALVSPMFGWLFLMPWAVLALTLPVVIVAIRGIATRDLAVP